MHSAVQRNLYDVCTVFFDKKKKCVETNPEKDVIESVMKCFVVLNSLL